MPVKTLPIDTDINIISFLANIFAKEPTLSFIEQLQTEELQQILKELDINYKDALWEQSPEQILDELEVEYTRLFIGPGPHIAPYESVQRGEAQLWGNYTVDVNKFYQRNGYRIADEFKELPDHISVELQFLAHLLQAEKKCLEKGQAEQVREIKAQYQLFLNNHLKQWLPGFTAQIKTQAKYAYYQAFAKILEQALFLSD